MNWKEISEKYPKAFYELLIWFITSSEYKREFAIDLLNEDDKFKKSPYKYFKYNYLTAYEDFSWNYRNLYDFFDEQEIFIEIEFYPIPESPKKPWTCNGTIFEGNDLHLKWCSEEYIKRSDAEEATFIKAFEILEEKLK